MNRRTFLLSTALVLASGAILSGCGGGGGGIDGQSQTAPDGSALLAAVGGQTLSLTQLRENMPGGLSEDDSAKYVSGYVHDWVDSRLMAEMAKEDVDIREIDRMVAEYRTALIAEAYRRKIASDGSSAAVLSEDSVRAYYDSRKQDFRLPSALVKGVYIKVPDNIANLPLIRRLMRSDKPEDIDRLEKEVVKSGAIHYDYFRERWVDWDQIEVRIPYSFPTPTGFLSPGKQLEHTAGGYTYLLSITDVLPAGSVMPYEAARDEVRERLMAERRRQLDAAFRADLLQRALASGRAKIYL